MVRGENFASETTYSVVTAYSVFRKVYLGLPRLQALGSYHGPRWSLKLQATLHVILQIP